MGSGFSSSFPSSYPSSSSSAAYSSYGLPVAASSSMPIVASSSLNEPQRQRMEEATKRCGRVVLQIRTPGLSSRGSGCLIGGVLLLTNYHVLREKTTARNSFACLFRVVSQDAVGRTCTEIVKIALDPDRCFIRSRDWFDGAGSPLPAAEGRLDFTIVGLQDHPYLATVQSACFSIFKKASIKIGSALLVVHYPEEDDVETLLRGDIKWSNGKVKAIKTHSLTYDANTSGGSSGGAVINQKGRLIALHHQGRSDGINAGILVSKIKKTLTKEEKRKVKEWISHRISPAAREGPTSLRILNLPSNKRHFTGRERELYELQGLCQPGERVAVVGLGGVGKTSLLTKYVNDHFVDYALICFIPCSTVQQVEAHLLALAHELKIPEVEPDQRLILLKNHLERQTECSLLIFDGVDDIPTLAYVKSRLPVIGRSTVVLTSRIQLLWDNDDFRRLDLKALEEEEAITYLLKAVNCSDAFRSDAKSLATHLHFFPLALVHAAAYIRLNPGCTLKSYGEDLDRSGLKIQDPRYNQNEQTILTTWTKSINAIKTSYNSSLPEDILRFMCLLGYAPVPKEILSRAFPSVDEIDLRLALQQLSSYSLLENLVDTCSLHALVKEVIRYQLGDACNDILVQALRVLDAWVKGLNLDESRISQKLAPFIPHCEAVIKLVTGSKVQENLLPLLHSFFDVLWKYYQEGGKYESAKNSAEEHLSLYRKNCAESLETAKCLNHLGESLSKLGKYEEALSCFKKGLAIRTSLGRGGTHPDVIESRFLIAHASLVIDPIVEKGAIRTAIDAFVSLGWVTFEGMELKIVENFQDDLARILSQNFRCGRYLGFFCAILAESDKAIECYERTIIVQKKRLGRHLEVALCHEDFGCILATLEREQEADAHFQEALAIRREVFGENHPVIARNIAQIAVRLNRQGRFEDALAHGIEALNMRKTLLHEHLETADSYRNIGITFGLMGEHLEAVFYHGEALKIRQNLVGTNHHDTAQSHRNFGVSLFLSEQWEKGWQHYELSLSISKGLIKQSKSKEHAHPLEKTKKDYARYVSLIRGIMAGRSITEESYFNWNISYEALMNSPNSYLNNDLLLKRFFININNSRDLQYSFLIANYSVKNVETYLKKIESLIEKCGEMHPLVATNHFLLGVHQYENNDIDHAIKSIKYCAEITFYLISINIVFYENLDRNILISYFFAGILLTDVGRNLEALECFQKNLSMHQKLFGNGHNITLISYGVLAEHLLKMKKNNESVLYYIEKIKFAADEKVKSIALFRLASICRNLSSDNEAIEYTMQAQGIHGTIESVKTVGQYLEDSRRYQKACEFYASALQLLSVLDPKNEEALLIKCIKDELVEKKIQQCKRHMIFNITSSSSFDGSASSEASSSVSEFLQAESVDAAGLTPPSLQEGVGGASLRGGSRKSLGRVLWEFSN